MKTVALARVRGCASHNEKGLSAVRRVPADRSDFDEDEMGRLWRSDGKGDEKAIADRPGLGGGGP